MRGVECLDTRLLLMPSPKIAQQWERAIVLRFGRYVGLRGPGLFWIVPFVDRVSSVIDQRTVATGFAAEQTLTADTVPVNVDAVLFWMVHDAEKAALEVQDYGRAVAHRRRGVPGWGVFTNKKLNGGGPMIDIGVHALDMALWLMGHPKPVSVYGVTFQKERPSHRQVAGDKRDADENNNRRGEAECVRRLYLKQHRGNEPAQRQRRH